MISEEKTTVDAAATADGTVVVSVDVSASRDEVWESLTDTAVVANWFGVLTNDLVSGGSARLDFGDGDFFDLDSVQLKAPTQVQYDWRFLGMGPCDSISWLIEPHENGCLVTVTDRQPGRTLEAAEQLREGWLDFTRRLVEFHATGQNTRYDWRRELDVGTEIKGSASEVWGLLFSPEAQQEWLPFDSRLESGTLVRVADEIDPECLRLDDVSAEPGQLMEFELGGDTWKQPTTCRIALTDRGDDTLVYVSHNGWEHISEVQAEQLQQRKRFCALWIEAVGRARQAAEQRTA